jgi:hypothetical protein
MRSSVANPRRRLRPRRRVAAFRILPATELPQPFEAPRGRGEFARLDRERSVPLRRSDPRAPRRDRTRARATLCRAGEILQRLERRQA